MQNWLGRSVLLATVVAAAASGCGGGGGAKPITTDDFCDQKAAKECDKVVGNCGATKDKCQAARKAVCAAFVADRKENSPSRAFKTANMANCLNKAAAAYANVSVTAAGLDAMNDACEYVFQGDAATNEKCTVKYDCASMSQICDKGKCAAKVNKNLGAGCSNPGEVCVAGSICVKDTDVFTCVAKHKMGEACDNDTNPCLEALHCLAGKCAERSGSGQACTTNDDCATTVPYCDSSFSPPKCDTGLTLGGNSAACGEFGGDQTPPPSGGTGGAAGGGTGGAAPGTDAGDDSATD